MDRWMDTWMDGRVGGWMDGYKDPNVRCPTQRHVKWAAYMVALP